MEYNNEFIEIIGSPIPMEIEIKCPFCGAYVKSMTGLVGILYCGYCGQII